MRPRAWLLCLLPVTYARSGQYAHEIKVMGETVDLCSDISDRYRRNDERLVKVQSELLPGALLQLDEAAALAAADPELTAIHEKGNELLRVLKLMKDEVVATQKRMEKIRESMSVMLQLDEGSAVVTPAVGSVAASALQLLQLGEGRRRRRRHAHRHNDTAAAAAVAIESEAAAPAAPIAAAAPSSAPEQPRTASETPSPWEADPSQSASPDFADFAAAAAAGGPPGLAGLPDLPNLPNLPGLPGLPGALPGMPWGGGQQPPAMAASAAPDAMPRGTSDALAIGSAEGPPPDSSFGASSLGAAPMEAAQAPSPANMSAWLAATLSSAQQRNDQAVALAERTAANRSSTATATSHKRRRHRRHHHHKAKAKASQVLAPQADGAAAASYEAVLPPARPQQQPGELAQPPELDLPTAPQPLEGGGWADGSDGGSGGAAGHRGLGGIRAAEPPSSTELGIPAAADPATTAARTASRAPLPGVVSLASGAGLGSHGGRPLGPTGPVVPAVPATPAVPAVPALPALPAQPALPTLPAAPTKPRRPFADGATADAGGGPPDPYAPLPGIDYPKPSEKGPQFEPIDPEHPPSAEELHRLFDAPKRAAKRHLHAAPPKRPSAFAPDAPTRAARDADAEREAKLDMILQTVKQAVVKPQSSIARQVAALWSTARSLATLSKDYADKVKFIKGNMFAGLQLAEGASVGAGVGAGAGAGAGVGSAAGEVEAWAGQAELASTVESLVGSGGEGGSNAQQEAAINTLLQNCQDAMDDVYRYTHELAERSKDLRSNLNIY